MLFVNHAVIGGEYKHRTPKGAHHGTVSEKQMENEKLTEQKIENYNKALELMKKMQESGINLSDLESLDEPLSLLSKYSTSMRITPIDIVEEANITPIQESFETDDEEEAL